VSWRTRLLDWIGGSIGRTAGTGLFTGLAIVILGVTPAQFIASIIQAPPPWLLSGWTRLLLVLVGLPLIFASLRFNVWSQRQRVIDDLAEDLSWAVHHLLNRPQPQMPVTGDPWPAFAQTFRTDFETWCNRVSAKLANEAFFTRADRLHFDRLGFITRVAMTGHPDVDHVLSMLKLKFERLREILNWVAQRPR
jgi:hypothetical protein